MNGACSTLRRDQKADIKWILKNEHGGVDLIQLDQDTVQ
jgi:hypothetical protein